ncbi:SAM-dependent methyltransferase [Paenibacillus turicensis]|uniref:SAM-dependent methyltransferase n=1 Tax=Paenibacillus turicensis TaxID=160487 RepID=A0ABS4FUX6_9BACL|nr:SAM-dependent methyltransferase [Paenibacillus turicensis]MBP1906379.1 SAM-dependent methyltransferase [Paenibacillus turicensis]
MESLRALMEQIIQDEVLITGTLSQLRKSEGQTYTKVLIKPVEIKKTLHYQFAYHSSNKVHHENVAVAEAVDVLMELFTNTFRQALLCTEEADYQVLISKKYKVSILTKSPTKKRVSYAHNRQKQYILEEGKPVPFLVELGIMNGEGKVLAKKYDKFKQINRFLEMIQDVLPHLPSDRPITILDFGCGKSYLTFALYHYLKVEQRRNLRIVGLDLKADVIEHCNQLATRLNYDTLRFLVGDIANYNELEQVDMVVTLHACDTATDAALEKAIRWDASVILSVPCCQHELFSQVNNDILAPMLEQGILKERFSALATDSIRAQLLDIMGYRTQLLEFIDMEHTPKNIMIRAIKTKRQASEQQQLWQRYATFRDFLHVSPYLEKACTDLLPKNE